MPTRTLLSEAQRSRLSAPPEMDARELASHHTLSEADLALVSVRRGRANRLGFAVQLCLLRYPGRPVRAGEAVVPRHIVEFVASQVGTDPDAFHDYARGRDTTRREHVAEIVRTFGFRPFDGAAYREFSRCLLPVAEGTDSGEVLVGVLLEEMRRRGIVAPALSSVEGLAWETRRRAQAYVFRKLLADLDEERLGKLDSLLIVPAGEDETPLNRIRRPPGPPSPKNFKDVIDRLALVPSLGLPEDAGAGINYNRLSRLAREGAKTTPQHLRRFDHLRRRATLVAYLAERSAELSDLALEMHDRMIGALMNRAEKMRDEGFRRHGKAINEKVDLYAKVGKALIAAKESGEDPYNVLEEMLGWERFVASVAEAEGLAMPANFDYLDFVEAGHHHVRRYAPRLLEAFDFRAAPSAEPPIEAVGVLREMNEKGKRKIPDDTPVSFVNPRWRDHVVGAEGEIDRRYYELSTLSELKKLLTRPPPSRRFARLRGPYFYIWHRPPLVDDYILERTEALGSRVVRIVVDLR